MLGRILSLLALLTIIVTTMTMPAHAAIMDMDADAAVHFTSMEHAPVHGDMSRFGHGRRHVVDTGLCDFVCAHFMVLLTMAVSDPGRVYARSPHRFPADERLASQIPGLNERPPKRRPLL